VRIASIITSACGSLNLYEVQVEDILPDKASISLVLGCMPLFFACVLAVVLFTAGVTPESMLL
jgi:hypothetical protein